MAVATPAEIPASLPAFLREGFTGCDPETAGQDDVCCIVVCVSRISTVHAQEFAPSRAVLL
jgi:hypothetical protein